MTIKTYRKAGSFRNFYSSIQSDLEDQSRRVQSALEKIPPMNEVLALFRENPSRIMTQYVADEISRISDDQIPRYMRHRYRYDVYPTEKRLDLFPPYLQIEPSSVCNFRCVFCYQTDGSFTSKSSGMMGMMPFDIFREIIDQIEGNVEFISLASRGEPLVCRDIDRMLEYCAGKFLGLKINTNASLLNEKHSHAILAGGVNTVVFSADAAEEPMYSQFRVGGNLEKILNNIRLFNDIKRTHYPGSKIISRVSGVKFNNEQDMGSMIDSWGELVDQVAFVAYNPWENVYGAPVNEVQTPCSDLWRRMFVWYDGKVNPCDTDYKSTLSVGNVKDRSITDLWRSPAYEALREKHLERKRSSLSPCQRCVVV